MGLRCLVFLVAGMLVFSSCEKDIGSLGMGMMPEDDLLTFRIDTLRKFNCSYYKDDAIRTTSYNLLVGAYTDPLFGTVSVDMYAPVYFDNPVINKDQYYKVESIELQLLDSAFHYGKKVPITLEMYEFLDPIDTTYYNNQGFSPHEKYITTLTLDTTYIDDTTKYKFEGEYFEKFASFISSQYYNIEKDPDEVNKSFYNVFRGFHFKPSAGCEAIVKLLDIQIKIKANVCDEYGECRDVIQYLYVTNEVDREDNIYFHPLHQFNVQHSHDITDSIGRENQSRIYLQPMRGICSEIKITDIDRWLDSQKVVINAVKMNIPLVLDPLYPAAQEIELHVFDGTTTIKYESQQLLDASSYTIYFSDFFKKFIEAKKSASTYTFELKLAKNNQYANRSVIKADELTVDVMYTKYK